MGWRKRTTSVDGLSFSSSTVTLFKPVPKINLSKPDAIKYLQRNEINIGVKEKGWQIVQYEGHNLGWINALSNRINNYYPKEYRILKAAE